MVDGGLAVVDAWARPTPAGASEAAIYVVIENRDAPDDRLVGAASPRCMVVTPHLTRIDDGIASMEAADEDVLGLGRGETVAMEPNGLHLMCLGLDEPLVDGDEIELELRFGSRRPIAVDVAVGGG